MTDDWDLLETIEEVRKQEFPELPDGLVKQIVIIERDFPDNRQESYKRISSLIDEYVASMSKDRENGG